MKLYRPAAALAIAVLLLTGCTTVERRSAIPARSTAAPAAASAAPMASPVIARQPSALPTPSSTPCAAAISYMAPTAAAAASASSGVFLTTYGDCGSRNTAVPLDETTGQDQRGSLPAMSLGYVSGGSISPDGRWAITVVGDDIHLLSLEGAGADVTIQGPIGQPIYGAFVWSPDSSQVAVAKGVQAAQIWLIDAGSRAARLLTTLDYVPLLSPVFAPDSGTLYLLGRTSAAAGAWPPVVGEPFVSAISTATGQITGRVSLPGLHAGSRPGATAADGYNAFFVPAMAASPDGRHLFVAPADADRLLVVDTATMTLQHTTDFALRRPAPERLITAVLNRLVGRAEAKGGNWYQRELQVSPDGQRLYLTGVADSGAGVPPEARTPLGLVVVDAQSFQVLDREPGVESVLQSPDGSRLFASGWGWQYEAIGGRGYKTTGLTGSGLLVVDTATLRAATATPGAVYHQMALSQDGRYVYVLSEGAGLQTARGPEPRCDQPCWQLSVLDARSGQAVAQRDLYWMDEQLLSARASRLQQ